VIDVSGSFVVPGFIDVHVHGVAGVDVQDTGDAIGAVASLLPRYGVTAFCPTSIACTPAALRQFLAAVWHHRRNGAGGVVTAVSAAGSSAATGAVTGAARVLPAHLESNFIHPDYRGAQPRACLRVPPGGLGSVSGAELLARHVEASTDGFDGLEILQVIAGRVSDVGIVTVAPELPGGLDLVQWLRANGHYASIGHTAADVDLAMAAFDGGITQATHLFNRMPPLGHRAPGAAGAVLARPDVVAELICDAYHVHPAMARVAIGAKGPHGLMAITDGTAGSGRPAGTRVRLGGQAVTVSEHAAVLDDGTLAGSTLTMDRAFRNIVTRFGASVVDAALMCATTPARALGLADVGVLAEGAAADVVVLDRDFRVQRTFLGGREVFSAG
jgi:N-acetylglucosamine-6-phosphate deacetylase